MCEARCLSFSQKLSRQMQSAAKFERRNDVMVVFSIVLDT